MATQCLFAHAQQVAIIDFEASCLPEAGESYPIEVALAKVDGSTRSWLIRPSPEWQFWDWSSEAEHLHGPQIESALAMLRSAAEESPLLARALSRAEG